MWLSLLAGSQTMLGKEMSTIYAKVAQGDKGFRLETKDAEFIDEWPTLVGDSFQKREDAVQEAHRHRWVLVPTWQAALEMEGIDLSLSRTLFRLEWRTLKMLRSA
jgi:CTP synthase (UTP-ammonia lyase)